jgi:hypothetical protein
MTLNGRCPPRSKAPTSDTKKGRMGLNHPALFVCQLVVGSGNGRYRQINGKRGALPHNAVYLDTAVMLLHNLLRHGETQPTAFGAFAAGDAVKALKEMANVLWLNAGGRCRRR